MLVLTLLGVAAPVLAAVSACPDDEISCCELDGASCVCCSNGPRVALTEKIADNGDAPSSMLRFDCPTLPLEDIPLDILHVPRH